MQVSHTIAAVRRADGCAHLCKLERRKRLRRAEHGVRGGPVALGHARGVAARRARVQGLGFSATLVGSWDASQALVTGRRPGSGAACVPEQRAQHAVAQRRGREELVQAAAVAKGAQRRDHREGCARALRGQDVLGCTESTADALVLTDVILLESGLQFDRAVYPDRSSAVFAAAREHAQHISCIPVRTNAKDHYMRSMRRRRACCAHSTPQKKNPRLTWQPGDAEPGGIQAAAHERGHGALAGP